VAQTSDRHKREKDSTILVAVFAHRHLREKMEAKIRTELGEDQKEISFLDPRSALGAQWPTVILVVDVATCAPNALGLTNVMTRATTSVICVINTTRKPMKGKYGDIGRGVVVVVVLVGWRRWWWWWWW
jgi:hypothetical protein